VVSVQSYCVRVCVLSVCGDTGALVASPAIGNDGTIFVGSGNQVVYAVSSLGTQLWSFLADGAVWSSPIVDANNRVYVGSGKGSLYPLFPCPSGDFMEAFSYR
jgi:outer membrane protein assembly factor BamB